MHRSIQLVGSSQVNGRKRLIDRLFIETIPANQMVLPFDIGKPSVAQHNTETINMTWPKEQLLRATWPEGSQLSAGLSSVTENRRLAVR